MKKKLQINKKKGILFFITGISGSGKTSIAKKIKKKINNKYGSTIVLSGDDLRKIFSLNKYSLKEREKYAFKYVKLCKKLVNCRVNVILATVSMFNSVRKWNKKNFENYVEIYIKSNIKKVIREKQKPFYRKKTKNVVGISIKPQYPKNPNVLIKNNFTNNLDTLSFKLFKKIDEIL